ncbi:hypothetical protein HPB50_018885 [Hyalomma asiaticum]|uniref:Uncharacterized protein n=1 Tax=Hyalomma asiaticum TaxID=266040 RepID=A0ACB7RWB7_HYAAI|nr:hypothetical protein HPB50_018885 [Hyalomma asiaticum]
MSTLALVVAALIASLIDNCAAQLKPGCTFDALRACGDDFLPYSKETQLPSSGQSFEKSCANQLQQLDCSIKFVNDCMEGLLKASSTVFMNGFKKNVEGVCSVGTKEHENYVKAVGCMNSVGTALNSCWRTFRNSLRKALSKAPFKDIVNYGCCACHDLESCVEQTLTPCESTGGKDVLIGMLRRAFVEPINLTCKEYSKGSEACKSLPKLPALGAHDLKDGGYIELLAQAAGTANHRN